ncbi:DUF2634 domain-containing protein [Paenibacillus sp. GSMTC-2017]|uniref:DUF2634 domain-containing protein n=1 Tax=Paenibacillus sp. GSMTC-2017 TaxID=2794350 RepID=UPI0018D80AA1|nr:DUF2634 domain-containing protein [Paenibacillus sp. GSMTC-2017]MBH5316698.1 DUF2634 domain-containing protein [Paenibacillus sp. GSMTC-2017]
MESLKMEGGDLVIQNGDFQLIRGHEEVIQCCRHEIATNVGEWFLNPSMGINYDLFVGKQTNEDMMRSELQQALLRDERIESVDSIHFETDRKARALQISFMLIGKNGESYRGEVGNLA